MHSIHRFFERYQIQPAAADLHLLARIASAFSNLPYENVTKILKQASCSGSDSRLRRTDEVLLDHLLWNTGGTCFSLCNALLEVITRNGFDAFVAMGDMHYGSNIHCAVIVRFPAADYLMDPGYLLHQPIRLPEEGQQIVIRTPMNIVMIKEEGNRIISLYTEESGRRKWRYRLRVWPVAHEEFEQHWIRSFSLNSMDTLLLSRVNETGRIYFRKERLEKVSPSSRDKRVIQPGETSVLSSVFGLPDDLIQAAQNSLNGRK